MKSEENTVCLKRKTHTRSFKQLVCSSDRSGSPGASQRDIVLLLALARMSDQANQDLPQGQSSLPTNCGLLLPAVRFALNHMRPDLVGPLKGLVLLYTSSELSLTLTPPTSCPLCPQCSAQGLVTVSQSWLTTGIFPNVVGSSCSFLGLFM